MWNIWMWKCEEVTKSITEMKKHVKANYSVCGSSTIFHIKLDRNYDNEANFKEHKQSEFFWKIYTGL